MSSTKTRHVVLYDTRFGRNDGAPLYFFNQLKKMSKNQECGIGEVLHLIPEGDLSCFGQQDYWWWLDWGEDGLPVEQDWYPPKDGGKTIYVASDTHLGYKYRLEKAKHFDYVFCNQKRATEEFIRDGVKAIWLPHAVEPKAYPTFEIIKKYDVCFIGHIQETENPNFNGLNRIDALDRLFKEIPEFYFGSRHPAYPGVNLFEDAAKKYCQSKVVFNISIGDDINMRVFEVLATKSLLLTNWLPTLEELFEDGKHLVTYKTYNEMVEKAKYYIEHQEEAAKIAEEGYKEVIAKHTYKHRIEKIWSIINPQ
jgi:glycosyltransferase involved in cell wall biosynthesis